MIAYIYSCTSNGPTIFELGPNIIFFFVCNTSLTSFDSFSKI